MTLNCKLAKCADNVMLNATWNPTTQQVEQETIYSTTSGLTPLVTAGYIRTKKKPKHGGYLPD